MIRRVPKERLRRTALGASATAAQLTHQAAGHRRQSKSLKLEPIS